MLTTSSAAPKTIAVVRIATSVFFLLFGEYKLSGPGFAHGGFQGYLQDFIANGAVGFYRPFLSRIILPHAVVFGYMVGVGELFIGISLLLGLWVRPASVLGVLYLLNLTLATWWGPGRGAPVWRYFGAELDHLPLLLLFVIFFAADAGRVWGLDGRRG
jgi:thiosulfate dehydrogenase (quinone) large subunit